jgi:hypothetical protein
MRKMLLFVALVAVLAAVVGAVGSGRALAYGHADGPLAQVEISANCNNPDFGLCQEVGLGGVWAWAEVDTGGSMDFTFAGCGHTVGGGGPGSAGAHGGPGEGDWYLVSTLDEAFAEGAELGGDAFPFFDTSKTYDSYYVLDFFPGTGSDDFIAVVPAGQGHYSFRPVHGATVQTQVAP